MQRNNINYSDINNLIQHYKLEFDNYTQIYFTG